MFHWLNLIFLLPTSTHTHGMVSCAYCGQVEALPYQCTLCMKHFCSVHKLPLSHKCTCQTDSYGSQTLRATKYELRSSHEELPYFIHSKTNVPYLVGRQGHTIIAVELKKFGWNIVLQKRGEYVKDLVATKNDEKWHIMVKTVDMKLSNIMHDLPVSADEIDELTRLAEQENALPVIAIVASDSAVLLSARNFMALSP